MTQVFEKPSSWVELVPKTNGMQINSLLHDNSNMTQVFKKPSSWVELVPKTNGMTLHCLLHDNSNMTQVFEKPSSWVELVPKTNGVKIHCLLLLRIMQLWNPFDIIHPLTPCKANLEIKTRGKFGNLVGPPQN
jgi:hypothetical protein